MVSVKAVCASFLLLGHALLATAKGSEGVRVPHVLAHMEAQGVQLDWQPFDEFGNMQLIMDSAVFDMYEQQAIAAGNTTELMISGDRISARDFSSVTCYQSGSWAFNSVLIAAAGQACERASWAVTTGSTQIIRLLTDRNGNRLRNEEGDTMSVVVTVIINRAGQFTKDWCNAAVKNLLTSYCQGKSKDTRGGTIAVMSDQNGPINASVSVDPTTDDCNC